MDVVWLSGLVGFAIAVAATPGPNNTLAAASGAAHGMLRTLPLLGGIGLGVAGIMFMAAAFGTSLVARPVVVITLKWMGVIYLLWLAIRVATATPEVRNPEPGARAANPAPGLIQGALLQFVNPKLWLMVSGAVVAYAPGGRAFGAMGLAVFFALLCGGITFISAAAWALLGVTLGQALRSPRAARAFNIAMAALLVASLIPVVIA